MSNYELEEDKLKSHLIELERKHKELDTELEVKYNNMTVTDEVRKMKTMCDLYDDLRPAAKRRPPMRRAAATRITNVK